MRKKAQEKMKQFKPYLDEESEEFQGIYKEWKAQAQAISSPEALKEFAENLLNGYEHDYGTIVKAAGTIVTAAAMMCCESEGLTGFQAWHIIPEFLFQFQFPHNEFGLKLLDMDKLLYPQNESAFEMSLPKDKWERMQKKAAKLLAEHTDALPEVKEHWQSIIDGKVPFGWKVKGDEDER